LLDFEERKRGLYNNGRTLIICQRSGLTVWKWHLEDQGVKSDRILVIDRKNRSSFDAELALGAYNYDYYIMHWDALIRLNNLTRHAMPSKIIKWDHVIGDEIHLAKNRNAKRTKEMKRVRATYKTGCSGTPADDKPHDFWSILHWMYPKDYSSYWRFYDRYLKWETHPQNGYRVIKGVKNMGEFHTRIAPYYIRRKLTDVVDSMPAKTHGEIRVALTPRQRSDYDAMHKYQVAKIGEAKEELLVAYKIAMYVRLQQMSLGTTELDWTLYERAIEK
jgi:SNF2 family DNA or RNA helicase